ncbi:MAG: stalk domain-containing protein [Clostridia bacterium]|nr:stalk domain-containing protein [Clostridia bacterium]
MKKVLAIFLALCAALSLAAAAAAADATARIIIDGEEYIPKDALGNTVSPFIENGSTYLSIRSISDIFDVNVTWDSITKTVYVGTMGGNASLGEGINFYFDGEEYEAKNVAGTLLSPIWKNGIPNLPIRAIATELSVGIEWDNDNRAVILTNPEPEKVEDALLANAAELTANEMFAIRNAASGKYASVVSEEAVSDTAFSDDPVGWYVQAVDDEYFKIVYGDGTYVMDVCDHSVLPGGRLIIWNNSGTDNQLFKFVKQSDGTYIIKGKQSQLNLESDGAKLIQNRRSPAAMQRWILEKSDAPKPPEPTEE